MQAPSFIVSTFVFVLLSCGMQVSLGSPLAGELLSLWPVGYNSVSDSNISANPVAPREPVPVSKPSAKAEMYQRSQHFTQSTDCGVVGSMSCN